MTATVMVTINDNGNGELTTELLTLSASVANPVDERIVQNLTSGDNTITVPSGATYCACLPPSSNTQALKEKSTGTDAGEPRGMNLPWLMTLNGQASFVINAAGAVTDMVFHFI